MDDCRFDRLVASLFVLGTRRGLFRRLAALPLSGMLAAFVAEEGEAGRRQRHARRDGISAQDKKRKRKGKK